MTSNRVAPSPTGSVSQPSLIRKYSHRAPQSAAHATPDPTQPLQVDQRTGISISLVQSFSTRQSPGLRVATPPTSLLARPTSSPPQLWATSTTLETVHPTVAASPSALTTEPSPSEREITAAEAATEHANLALQLLYSLLPISTNYHLYIQTYTSLSIILTIYKRYTSLSLHH